MQMIELTSSHKGSDKYLLNVAYIKYIGVNNREDQQYSGTNCMVEVAGNAEDIYYVKETYEELKNLLCLNQ